jgi:hypothetical protein
VLVGGAGWRCWLAVLVGFDSEHMIGPGRRSRSGRCRGWYAAHRPVITRPVRSRPSSSGLNQAISLVPTSTCCCASTRPSPWVSAASRCTPAPGASERAAQRLAINGDGRPQPGRRGAQDPAGSRR